MIRPFELHRPATAEEACDLLARLGDDAAICQRLARSCAAAGLPELAAQAEDLGSLIRFLMQRVPTVGTA